MMGFWLASSCVCVVQVTMACEIMGGALIMPCQEFDAAAPLSPALTFFPLPPFIMFPESWQMTNV